MALAQKHTQTLLFFQFDNNRMYVWQKGYIHTCHVQPNMPIHTHKNDIFSGRLMLVDLQGWLPKEGRGVVYLTDPQFHTCSALPLSACDMGEAGMQAFWTSVHPQCNEICKALDLQRP